jgi:DNA-binding transcriptional LysR family regulator
MMDETINLGDVLARGPNFTSAGSLGQSMRRRIVGELDQGRWDDLAAIRALATAQGFRQAATRLKISVNTLRSRLTRIETALETTLFARTREGLRITEDGKIAVEIAREIGQLSARLPRGNGNNILVQDGQIRISASEGVGAFWLAPRLPELKARLPDLTVSFDCFADQNQLRNGDHDISIGFSKPDDREAIVSKLCTIHMMPFASADYVRRHGNPHAIEDIGGHQCVMQDTPGLKYDSLAMFVGAEQAEKVISIRVNSSCALFWAVSSGVGIGSLPTYVSTLSRKLTPIELPIRLKFELWLSYDRSARNSAPVRAAVQWLRTCFDPAKYPWFSEHFIHPRDLNDDFADSQVIPIFDHVIDG